MKEKQIKQKYQEEETHIAHNCISCMELKKKKKQRAKPNHLHNEYKWNTCVKRNCTWSRPFLYEMNEIEKWCECEPVIRENGTERSKKKKNENCRQNRKIKNHKQLNGKLKKKIFVETRTNSRWLYSSLLHIDMMITLHFIDTQIPNYIEHNSTFHHCSWYHTLK